MARGMGGQSRAPLHSRRHPCGADRSRRRLGDGEADRPRRADHRHARRLSPRRHARRPDRARQGGALRLAVLDRRSRADRQGWQAGRERPRNLFYSAAKTGMIGQIISAADRERTSMKLLLSLAAIAGLTAVAFAADNPDWAYPETPPPQQLDDTVMKSVSGSNKQYTQKQIDDPFNPPDWFPDEHPPMPQVVAHGGAKPAGRACAQCHLPSGDGHPESASLAGLPTAYVRRQMEAFKTGIRSNVRAGVMIAMAQVLTDDEIKAASEYFNKLKPTAGYNKLVETDTVPKSYIGAGGMRFASDGDEKEPIGERIINLPNDATEAKLRDPHSGFTDYVPSGSVAKGQALVNGGGGKTVACSL